MSKESIYKKALENIDCEICDYAADNKCKKYNSDGENNKNCDNKCLWEEKEQLLYEKTINI